MGFRVEPQNRLLLPVPAQSGAEATAKLGKITPLTLPGGGVEVGFRVDGSQSELYTNWA